MSDRTVKIGIETTADTSGAEKAKTSLGNLTAEEQRLIALKSQFLTASEAKVAEVYRMAESAKQARQDLNKLGDVPLLDKLPGKAKTAAKEVKELGKESAKLGKGQGNSATAVLELSRAFEDAQYGIRGVLNNIPGIIAALGGGAGLAGVISIAAVAGSVLWEKFGGGAKTAKGETEDLADTFSKLLKVYKDFEDLGKDTREKAATDVAGALKKDLSGIDNTFQISVGAEDIATAKATAEAQIKLAEDKLGLARVEAKLITATGEDAVKLAKQREGVIKQIYEDEKAIAEIGRTAAINKAQAKVEATGGKANALDKDKAKADFSASGLRSEVEGLRAAADANIVERTALDTQIKALQARLAAIKPGVDNIFSVEENVKKGPEIKSLNAEIKALLAKQSGLDASARDTVAQADAKEPALVDAEQKLASSTSELAAAVAEMRQAARDLSNLRQTQDIQRTGEAGLKKVADAGAADQKLAGDKTDVVGQLDSLVSGIGESGGKDLAPFITEMKSILQDKALSADELARLPTLLAQYFGKIANLGQGQNKAIRDAMSQVDDLEREVRGLKSTASGRNP